MRRLVMATVFMSLVATAAPAHAVDADRARGSWDDLAVPYLQYKEGAAKWREPKVRFQGTRAKWAYPNGLMSMAATADSAFVVENAYGGSGKDFEGPVHEIAADGTVRRVERRALGIPLADPLGHTAYWTKRESKRRDRLVAYDTTTHTRINGPLIPRGDRVFAVDGDTAYLITGTEDDATGAVRWAPGDAATTLVPLPPSGEEDEGRILVDVDGDRIVSIDLADEDGPTYLSDPAGNIVDTLPVLYSTFSPDGRYLSMATEQRVKVYDTETGTVIVPKLSKKRTSLDSRWAPDGRLVLNVVKRDVWGDYDEGTPVRRYVCTLPDGACRRLPGVSRMYFEPYFESSSFGQFIAAILPHISRTSPAWPKAAERYLRQR